MTHLYYGDPSEEFSQKLATTLLESGADVLEIGIPYADPVCDGEVFQHACKRALEAGTTPYKVLEEIKRIRKRGYKQKIYLTSYYAPIFKIGPAKFTKLAKEAGVDGFIVPDLLLEEQEELRKSSDKFGLSLIQFATIYSTKERLRQILRESRDFIYCISIPGVTGGSGDNKEKIRNLIKSIRSIYSSSERSESRSFIRDSSRRSLPRAKSRGSNNNGVKIMVGFGIKSAEDVKKIIKLGADGVIVGSAIARIYEKTISQPEKSLSEVSGFIKRLKKGTISL